MPEILAALRHAKTNRRIAAGATRSPDLRAEALGRARQWLAFARGINQTRRLKK